MAKKTKRQAARKTNPVTRAGNASAQTSTPVVSSNGSRMFEREFNPDYAPVIKDLRRIGMLAGSFFLILVVLSFFLR